MGTIAGTGTTEVPTTDWHVRFNHREYERTGNPVFVWEAIAECLVGGVELPTWVRKYLLTVASKITAMSRNSVPRKNRVTKAVASAVGLECRGQRNPFDELGRHGHELMIAFDVYGAHTDNWQDRRARGVVGNDWKAICEAGAERHNKTCDCGRHIGWKTAERYFRKHAKTVIPGHLQRKSKSQKLADILR